ncbi:MAG: PT domain-containing protein, partial [Propionibacteriaceae bacterium]|nr:PT domain-containing protein [Propionibacteriaceae bacterium]
VDKRVEAVPESERNLMYAGASHGKPRTQSFEISPDLFHEGTNVVAVALYQDSKSSSDIYFDMPRLTMTRGDEPVDPDPTDDPSDDPSDEPTEEPSEEPTVEPSEEPSAEPTVEPSEEPTEEPSQEPTAEPTEEPEPTVEPSVEPSKEPEPEASEAPSVEASEDPTTQPAPSTTGPDDPRPTNQPQPGGAGKSPNLPHTGAPVAVLGSLSLVAVIAGLVLLVARRRSRWS